MGFGLSGAKRSWGVLSGEMGFVMAGIRQSGAKQSRSEAEPERSGAGAKRSWGDIVGVSGVCGGGGGVGRMKRSQAERSYAGSEATTRCCVSLGVMTI